MYVYLCNSMFIACMLYVCICSMYVFINVVNHVVMQLEYGILVKNIKDKGAEQEVLGAELASSLLLLNM